MQFHVVADMVYPCVKQAGDIATTCALARHMMPPASDLGTGLQLNSAIMQPRASENGVYNNIGSYHTQPEGHVLHHTPTRAPQTTCTTRQLACQGVVYVAGEARVTCILITCHTGGIKIAAADCTCLSRHMHCLLQASQHALEESALLQHVLCTATAGAQMT